MDKQELKKQNEKMKKDIEDLKDREEALYRIRVLNELIIELQNKKLEETDNSEIRHIQNKIDNVQERKQEVKTYLNY